jgi:hypothetical protein
VVERLKPGGVLLIWDFLPHGPLHRHRHGHDHTHSHSHTNTTTTTNTHGNKHTETGNDNGNKNDGTTSSHDVYHSVMHHGFSEPRMREIFTAAGAGMDFRLDVIGGGFVLGHAQPQQQKEETVEDGKGDANQDKEAFRRQVFFARGTKGRT